MFSDDFAKGLGKKWTPLGEPTPEIAAMESTLELLSVDGQASQGITSQPKVFAEIDKDSIIVFDALVLKDKQPLEFIWHSQKDYEAEGTSIIQLTMGTKIKLVAYGRNRNTSQCEILLDDPSAKHTYAIAIYRDRIDLMLDQEKTDCSLPIILSQYNGYLSFFGSGKLANVNFILRDK